MKIYNILIACSLVFLLSSCEDVIDVDLAEGDNQMVVDAWINNKAETQTVRLVRASPYFDSNPSPGITGASVSITDNEGEVFDFMDADNDGDYTWTPEAGNTFGKTNNVYQLRIELDGEVYTSTSAMLRVPAIDSITTTFEEESLGQPEGYYAELFAKDINGPGDAYWIKTYKNGQFLNKPGELNIAFDAGFTAGAMVDGVTFITPIRTNVNRLADSGDGAIDVDSLPPYILGDSVRIEIHSLNLDAFFFLQEAQVQMTLGDAGIFANPPANVSTNIIQENAPADAPRPVGFFNISSVSAMEKRVE